MRRTRGIVDVIRDGDRPALVRQDEMAYLMERFDELGTKKLNDGRFSRGQRVRALAGPFCDEIGEFEVMKDRDRVVVMFDMLGRKVPVEMGERELAVA